MSRQEEYTRKKNWRRAERAKRAEQNPDAVIGKDGRVIVPKTVAAVCQRAECGVTFACVITTRAVRHCDKCMVIVAEERRIRHNTRKTQRAVWRRNNPKVEGRRLIRYAGYDPSERRVEQEDA